MGETGAKEMLLEVQDLRVRFFTRRGEVPALDGMNLTVRRGDTLGLVGESGSGKSVFCWSVLNLVRPPGHVVGGQILFEGRDILRFSPAELLNLRGGKIALIVSGPRAHLNPLLTVGEQVARIVRQHQQLSARAAYERAVELFEDVGIPDPRRRAQAYPHELSGGMAQRIVIAMALSCQPSLLLADEPTSGLDVTIQVQILDLIRRLIDDARMTAILATRDLGVVAQYCNSVAVMDRGQVLETGEVTSFFENAQHPYSHTLLDAFSLGREAANYATRDW